MINLKNNFWSSVDETLLDSTHHPMRFLGDVPSSTGSSQSALPPSHYTAFKSPDLPVALPLTPEPNHKDGTADSKSSKTSDFLAEEPYPFSAPSLIPSESVLGSNPKHEAPTKFSTDWMLARTNSAMQSSFPSTLTKSQLKNQANVSITSLSSSLYIESTTPQPSSNSKQDSALDLKIPTSQPGQPLETITDLLADRPYSKILDVNQLRPSSANKENIPAHDNNLLPSSNEILAPHYNVPFIAPHPTSPSYEPTEVSPEDFYPTNTMELDWGSGDYLETMSFLNSDGDNYPLVTKVPSDSYDLEDYTETYDTSFPSRVGISFSSLHPLHLSPSPTLMTTYSTTVPFMSIHPSSLSSTIHSTPEPTPIPNSDTASDTDWPDTFTIQPTDVLLPDMNSLEYYTIQLNKENISLDTGAEQRGNVTVMSIDTTDITPTGSLLNDTKLSEEDSFSDASGVEPIDDSNTEVTTEESPQLVSASEPFLDPSVVPSLIFEPSSSLWGAHVSTTDWSGPALSLALDNTALTETILLHDTPLLPDDVMTPSSLGDIHWFVTEPFPQSTILTTPVLTETIAFSPAPTEPTPNTTPLVSTFTTEPNLNTTLISSEATSNVTLGPPAVLSDEGVTEHGVDMPATMTLIPTSSEANTVSALPTTTTATTTSHQPATTITATTEASTSVDIVSTARSTTTAPPRQFLCSLDRPSYLVKICKFNISFCI